MTIQRNEKTNDLFFSTAGGLAPLQVARWSGLRRSIVLSVTTARITLPAGSVVVELLLSGTDDVTFIAFGDNSVEAVSTIADNASRKFLPGVQVVPVPIDPATGVPYTHLAAIDATNTPTLQIEKVE